MHCVLFEWMLIEFVNKRTYLTHCTWSSFDCP